MVRSRWLAEEEIQKGLEAVAQKAALPGAMQ
jgi:hypothetical protein